MALNIEKINEIVNQLSISLISENGNFFSIPQVKAEIIELLELLNAGTTPELSNICNEINAVIQKASECKSNKNIGDPTKRISELLISLQNLILSTPHRSDSDISKKNTQSSGEPHFAVPEHQKKDEEMLNIPDDEREIYGDFVTESLEHIQQIEKGILELENNSADAEIINSMFRCFHSIKGNSGFLNLKVMNNLSHKCEGLLDKLRSKKMNYTEEITDIVLEAIDILKGMLGDIGAAVRDKQPLNCHYEIETFLQKIEDVKNPIITKDVTKPSDVNKSDSAEIKQPQEATCDEFNVNSLVNREEEEFIHLPEDSDISLIGEFITESNDNIAGAEAALLSLETQPDDMEAVNTCFRAFHTMKGTAGFIGIKPMAEFAHHAESLLSRIRDRKISYTPGYADLALRSIDMFKELIQSLQTVLGGETASKPSGYTELIHDLMNPESVTAKNSMPEIVTPRLGDILVADGKADRNEVEKAASSKSEEPIGVKLVKNGAASLQDVAGAIRKQQSTAAGDSNISDTSVRVRTDRLDRLIDMVGELVISQSMVSQDISVAGNGYHELSKKISHTGKIVRELQDLTMSMRMVPLKPTFQKMTRLIRDLSRKSGKIVNFITQGDDTEIDRNMVDVINDPLVHMLRNAADHGVELPEIREKNGKAKEGTISLSAYHSGGNVVIEIKDDGKGIDREKVIKKAVAAGLIDPGKNLSDSEVFNLIFEPGFSTADKVTDISGRGVGMDVVKRGVESLRGKINLTSVAGKGSTFSMYLPLTMAITDGMLVKVGSERYLIPTVNISMSFRPDAKLLFTVGEKGEIVMLRDNPVPIFRLHSLFGIKGAVENPLEALLVIIDDGNQQNALLVDELLGQHQVVAKPLGNWLGQIPGVSGGAILGDGHVGLILDSSDLIAAAKQNSTASDCRYAA
ncbi:MAG: Hpt domain-containing protein [Candidatus Schekmanbacteria bacterium]|nr:Hpt domain-containing protein [Candidatus Schekmanbacteria bacterium]